MNFFVLKNPKAGNGIAVTDFLPIDGSVTGDAPQCAKCGKFLGMRPLLPPIRVELETWGTECGDIAFGPGDEILMSVRVRDCFREFGLTGIIDLGPVEIVNVNSHRKLRGNVSSYRCCRVSRSRAVIDDVKSDLQTEEPWACEECRIGGIIKRGSHFVLENGSWSGEDIFFARGLPGIIMTSERFAVFCQQSDVLNAQLFPAGEFAFDYYPWEKTVK